MSQRPLPNDLLPFINLGCGSHYHPRWVNVDVIAHSNDVLECDLSRGIPFEDNSFEVVYHSHVLEHFRKGDARRFLKECFRVAKPEGIIRVAVPDLERICRVYLEKLEAVLRNDQDAKRDYQWIMLEMFDQAVREEAYSEMWHFLHQPCENRGFVESRIGQLPPPEPLPAGFYSALFRRLRAFFWRQLNKTSWGRAYSIGRFRLSGVAHQWMYDRYSLSQLLIETGFQQPIVQTAASSRIPNWRAFNLDTLADGSVYKPDSLFMEAVKHPQ